MSAVYSVFDETIVAAGLFSLEKSTKGRHVCRGGTSECFGFFFEESFPVLTSLFFGLGPFVLVLVDLRLDLLN